MSSAPWWTTFFDDLYADFGLASREPEENEPIIEFLWSELRMGPGVRVFDQCCGVGRLALPLARRGANVIGVDITPRYIERARQAAAAENLPCEFHCADAFDFVAPEQCNAAFNWFTSFGYTDDDVQNRRMLERAFESLKPGGRFAIDYINIARVLRRFRGTFVHRQNLPARGDRSGGELIVIDDPTIDFERGMIRSTWTFILPDGRREVREVATRMLLPHDLARLLREAGFVDTELCGWPPGESMSLRSKRVIVLARRA